MKKLLLILGLLLSLFTFTSCTGEEKTTTTIPSSTTPELSDVEKAKLYFDNPALEIDHYFSNKLRLSDTGVTVKKNNEGKLEGQFINDGIAKLKLKSITDGDTMIFHLNSGETDTYTVKGKTYYQVTIRCLGIDTPESTSSIQPWGKAASNYAKSVLMNAEGIIVDASDLPGYDSVMGYTNRIDSNGTRWLGLIWYCPEGGNPEDLSQYRSYQLDLIEECYSFAASMSSNRTGYIADATTEPILYNRYDKIEGEEYRRYGTLKLGELFFEADNRMSRTGKKIRIQGETDPNFDYNKKPTSMSITEAKQNFDTLSKAGTFVELKGVITRFVCNNFYFEDENGSALYVYMGIDGNSISSMFTVGDTIKIRGRLCEYGGQMQMSGIEFKKETFIKVTEESEKVPMPTPIVLTGNETIDELYALVGRLVQYDFTCSYVGNPSKDGSYSLTDDHSIKNHPLTGTDELQYDSDDKLQVRINGLLIPSYDRQQFVDEMGSTYTVTGIMSLYYEADYQNPKEMANPKPYYSYQITVGNRLVNGEVLNEIVKK